MKKIIILGLTALFCGSFAYAGGGDDYCKNTTKKCGTTVKEPLDGYGDQRCKKDSKKDKKDSDKTRCGGCGKYVKDS